MNTILIHFKEGGLFMYFILIFVVLTALIIVERFLELYIKHKSTPKDFRKNILTYIAKADFKSAQDYIEMTARETSLGKISLVACKLRGAGAGDEALQARMDEQLSKEISAYDKRTGFLAMFGNVATLFGLLGTVTGMIGSFAGVASASPAERASMLSSGISEALNATAFGLIAAIPALIAFAVFQNRTDQIVNELTESASEIYHDFLFYTESYRGENEKISMPKNADVLGSATNRN